MESAIAIVETWHATKVQKNSDEVTFRIWLMTAGLFLVSLLGMCVS
jgi:hypothetical protein